MTVIMRSVIKLRSLQNNSYLYLSHRPILPAISRAGWTQLAPERFRVDRDGGEYAFGSQRMYTCCWFLDREVDAGDAEDEGYDGDMRSVIKLRSLQNNSYLYLSHRSILLAISRAGWTQLAPE
jgi:hypothetical protein